MASNLGAYFCSSLVRSSSAAPSPISRASVSFKARAPARLADETHDPSLYFTRGEAWPASELSLFPGIANTTLKKRFSFGLEIKEAK